MNNEEMLAKIKIKLIKDPVNLGQQVEQQVETPSMLRRVITDASFMMAMRGIVGLGKGIRVNPNRVARRVVRQGVPERVTSRVATHEELTHRTATKLPSIHLMRKQTENVMSQTRVASMAKKRALRRPFMHKSQIRQDVRERALLTRQEVAQEQRRTQLVSQRNELVQQTAKLKQEKMQLARRLGGMTSSRNKYRELAGERPRTKADYDLGVRSLHSMRMDKRMGFDVQTTDEQVRAIQEQAMDNLKRQYEEQLVPVRVTVPVMQNTRYMEATR